MIDCTSFNLFRVFLHGKLFRVMRMVTLFAVMVAGFVFPQARLVAGFSLSPAWLDLAAEGAPHVAPGTARGHPRLEWVLWELHEMAQRADAEAVRRYAAQRGIRMRGDQAQVIMDTQDIEGAKQVVVSLGGVVEGEYRHLLQVLIEPKALHKLAKTDSIKYVRRPLPNRVQAVQSEGIPITGAPEWHSSGLTGAGTKIAVLDLGFDGYETLLGTELPPSLIVQSFTGDITGGGESHGVACAEVAHEMAPDAELYLVNFSTEVEFGQAVDWLIQQGVDVISCSIVWVNAGPYDGTGFINEIVEDAYVNGILWVNAIGNQARRHWEGIFRDEDGDRYHEYDTSVELDIFYANAGQEIAIFLSWEDSWTNAIHNYDLHLFRWSGWHWIHIASSENPQDGSDGQTPTEAIVLTAPLSAWYGAVVRRHDAELVHLELYSFSHNLALYVSDSSLLIPSDAEHALSMGAFRWDTGQLETFSGRGPTNDGRLKPDLIGPDFVSTVTYGSLAFSGTSAPTPHAAGAAVLVKQGNANWSPDRIKAYLLENARDNPGTSAQGLISPQANNPPNNRAGYGEVYLGADPMVTVDIPLAEGWNLFSLPVVPPDDDLTVVLSSIEGSYDLVYAYDAHNPSQPWKTYSTAVPPFMNTLTTMEVLSGYWLRVSEAVTLSVTGTPTDTTDIPLVIGWNLVGYPSRYAATVSEALQSINGQCDLVYGYDAHDPGTPWKTYSTAVPPFMNTLTDMQPAWGYWLRATEDCVWQVSGLP